MRPRSRCEPRSASWRSLIYRLGHAKHSIYDRGMYGGTEATCPAIEVIFSITALIFLYLFTPENMENIFRFRIGKTGMEKQTRKGSQINVQKA